jgi:DNA-binding response OmpR family regulator
MCLSLQPGGTVLAEQTHMKFSSQPTLLIVSSDTVRARAMQDCLHAAGYKIILANRGDEGAQMVSHTKAQLIILDWNLYDLSPLAVIRAIRADARYQKLPIILTAKAFSAEHKILALETGADLCMEGIIHPNELVARIHSMLRRVSFCEQLLAGSPL